MSINGTDVLIAIETAPGSGVFKGVGGLTDNVVTLNSYPIDISSKSFGDRRELMDLNGFQTLDVEGQIVFSDNEDFQMMRASALNKTILNYQIDRDGDVWSFGAKIVQWIESAPDNDKLVVTLSMQSSGDILDA